jgi:hypothetical protein
LLYDKYFKGLIHYEGLQRVETYPVHPDAMREAVLNATYLRRFLTGATTPGRRDRGVRCGGERSVETCMNTGFF